LLVLDKCVSCTLYIPFAQDIVLRTSKCTGLKIKLCKIVNNSASSSSALQQPTAAIALAKQQLELDNGQPVKLIEVAEFEVPDYQQEGYMFSGGGDEYRDYCINDLRQRKLKQYMWTKPKVKKFYDTIIQFQE